MIDIKLKGLFNQHTLVKNDFHNISNDDNKNVYNQVIVGNTNSEMVSYLLNLNHQRLSDVKSILAYNEINQAGMINEAQVLNEIYNSETIKLSKPQNKIKTLITNALRTRHSSREFSGIKLSESVFSTLLHYSFGIAPRKMHINDITVNTRFYASGGGLYPIKVYIYINNIEGIEQGLYLYQPLSHTLLSISKDKKIEISEFYEGKGIYTESANFCVFYALRISSSFLKYGELSLLLALTEVGEMIQNFDLVATSLGLSSCTIAGFKKTYIENLLDFDHIDEHVLLSSICGKE